MIMKGSKTTKVGYAKMSDGQLLQEWQDLEPFEKPSADLKREYDKRLMQARYGEFKDNFVEFEQIRRERLNIEIAHLKEGIDFIKQSIKHVPHPAEDKAKLYKELDKWYVMLASAHNDVRELDAGKMVFAE